MPKMYRGRKYGRRRGYRRKTAFGIAKAAYSLAKTVQKDIAPEYKTYIIDTIPVVISHLGNVYDLVGAGSGYAGIQQGIAHDDRTGDHIRLQRIVMRGIIKRSQTAAIESVRMIIFRGKEGFGGSVPTPSFYLQSLDVYSSKNDTNRYVTKTLYDNVIVVDDVKNQYHEINLNLSLDWPCSFEPSIPTVSSGGLYMLLLGSTGTVANQPSWEGYFRLTYTDA